MNILLVGEYSRLHNSLKEGLERLGHSVVLVGNGDHFKKYPVDVDIEARWSKSKILNLPRQILFRLFKYDIAKIEEGLRFHLALRNLRNFDVVQLVSETPIQTVTRYETWLMRQLRARNPRLFILSSGADVPFVDALFKGKFRYSLIDPLLQNPSLSPEYGHLLEYRKPALIRHHKIMYGMCDGVIATDIDYAIPLEGYPQFLGVIPNPVNVEKLKFNAREIRYPISIFLGINRANYHKKGIPVFEKALEIVRRKFGDKVEISVAENVPYNQYILLYERCHIVLDQVFAYDQGYNALEAMARGKVVFTGAETEFDAFYGLTRKVAINALPDADQIAAELSGLIENPDAIVAIGRNAREFVEEHHHFETVARRYLQVWSNKKGRNDPALSWI